MRIGLLSDTHVPEAVDDIPMPQIKAAFKGVNLIMHGGDIYDVSVLNQLSEIAPVIAAFGDDDYGAAAKDERVKERHILDIEGHRIWLIHERPKYLAPPPPLDRRAAEFPNMVFPEVVVFGHLHKTVVENYEGIVMVNPGSPTFLHYKQGLGTVGILNINDGKIDVNILHL
jgi:uncharacterized protein